MTFPDKVLDWPFPLRVPTAPNELTIPFAPVTSRRLVKGVWYFIRSKQFETRGRYELPGGWLFMHPGDYEDLVVENLATDRLAEVFRNELWAAHMIRPARLFGAPITLETTQHPDYARRGVPRLRLTDGTDVLL